MPLDHNTVKGWFISRAKPLASQFAQWIDACWFKGEKIPIADIEGISTYFGQYIPPVDISFSAAATYTIPAGYAIYQMYLNSANDDATIRMGTAVGLDDIMGDSVFVAGKTLPIQINIPAMNNTTVHITGATSATSLRIYLHKI